MSQLQRKVLFPTPVYYKDISNSKELNKYLFLTILSLIKCYNKGFVLSVLSASKWLLAYVITLIIFPRTSKEFTLSRILLF